MGRSKPPRPSAKKTISTTVGFYFGRVPHVRIGLTAGSRHLQPHLAPWCPKRRTVPLCRVEIKGVPSGICGFDASGSRLGCASRPTDVFVVARSRPLQRQLLAEESLSLSWWRLWCDEVIRVTSFLGHSSFSSLDDARLWTTMGWSSVNCKTGCVVGGWFGAGCLLLLCTDPT